MNQKINNTKILYLIIIIFFTTSNSMEQQHEKYTTLKEVESLKELTVKKIIPRILPDLIEAYKTAGIIGFENFFASLNLPEELYSYIYHGIIKNPQGLNIFLEVLLLPFIKIDKSNILQQQRAIELFAKLNLESKKIIISNIFLRFLKRSSYAYNRFLQNIILDTQDLALLLHIACELEKFDEIKENLSEQRYKIAYNLINNIRPKLIEKINLLTKISPVNFPEDIKQKAYKLIQYMSNSDSNIRESLVLELLNQMPNDEFKQIIYYLFLNYSLNVDYDIVSKFQEWISFFNRNDYKNFSKKFIEAYSLLINNKQNIYLLNFVGDILDKIRSNFPNETNFIIKILPENFGCTCLLKSDSVSSNILSLILDILSNYASSLLSDLVTLEKEDFANGVEALRIFEYKIQNFDSFIVLIANFIILNFANKTTGYNWFFKRNLPKLKEIIEIFGKTLSIERYKYFIFKLKVTLEKNISCIISNKLQRFVRRLFIEELGTE